MYMVDTVYIHGMEIYNDRFLGYNRIISIPNNRQKMLGSFSYDDELQSKRTTLVRLRSCPSQRESTL